MSNKRKLVLSFVLLFVIAYLSFSAWIAHDTKIILKEAMSQDANRKYMNSSAFESINPVERGMKADSFKYNPSSHHIGFVLPLHFFVVSKAFVTQKYENADFGFREPVKLTLILKSGKWYATKATSQP
ncbi:hypothetical protein HQN87_03575 [Paenibacillus tritici]|uniref:Uncharacterized protein n=1 Tax=Paenibacillus tritici TaxID=1873425 RepID=A0ABX2DK13_9BACL|nr:hypothetical protein [Paenibacillus tritici]NQX44403.1 hypothetical protein [Paenibacillus tritici]